MRNAATSDLVADCLDLSVLLFLSIGNGRLKYHKIREGGQKGFYVFIFLLQPHAVLVSLTAIIQVLIPQ